MFPITQLTLPLFSCSRTSLFTLAVNQLLSKARNYTSSTMEHPAFTLGGLSLVGGIMGYAKKGSLPSLVAGVSVSAIYFGAGYLLKNNMEYGIHTALAASTIMLGAGVSRSLKTNFKPVPVMLAVLGATSTAYYAYKYTQFY